MPDFISVAAVALLFAPGLAPSDAIAARKDCGDETDSGKRLKCRTENLNDAVDGLVTTALIDNTGAFTENQKKQLENVKNRGRSESERIKPEDFKQLAKKRKVDSYIQEIVGDVDPANDDNSNGECDGTENCIGNEDGICDRNEMNSGGCAEILNDGIGDDDGICEVKGYYARHVSKTAIRTSSWPLGTRRMLTRAKLMIWNCHWKMPPTWLRTQT